MIARDQVDIPGTHPRPFLREPEPLLAQRELPFLFLALRDVVRDPERAEQGAVSRAIRTLRREKHGSLVPDGNTLLERLHRAALKDQPVGLGHRVRHRPRQYLVQRAPDQIFSRQAERLSRARVQSDDTPVEILDEDVVGRSLDHGLEYTVRVLGLRLGSSAAKRTREDTRNASRNVTSCSEKRRRA